MMPSMTIAINWQVIRLGDLTPSPWRNGGGTTRELVAWPDGPAWQWRASVAEVAQTGPFSTFTGVQRWFAVLQGDGVCLTVDGYMHMLSKSDEPLQFDGAAATDCELLGGPTRDFNLMLQGSATARVQRVIKRCKTTIKTPKIIAAYAHKTRARVQIGTEIHTLLPHSFGWTAVPENTDVEVRASNALFLEIEV